MKLPRAKKWGMWRGIKYATASCHAKIVHCANMKTLLALLFLAGLAASNAADTYTDKYDNINLDEILNNERLYQNYFNCFANTGKCTKDAEELKEVIPDALKTKCAKCTDKQKAGIEKVVKFTVKNKPQDYLALEKIWDPEGNYRKLWEEEAKARGIELPPRT